MTEHYEIEPPRVRCARGLGCDPLIYNSGRAECLCADYRHAADPGLELKPYGENSPAGWACTGPLIGRFGLEIVAPSSVVPQWGCLIIDTNYIVTAANACAAIAEWVARFAPGEAGDCPELEQCGPVTEVEP